MAEADGSAWWRRVVDGWQAGLVLLLIAGSTMMTVLPFGAEPEALPAPIVDHQALAATMAADDARARAAAETPLDVDVRHVGDELRTLNLAAAAGDDDALLQAKARLLRATDQALALGIEPLLALRAYHTLRFLEELRRWQAGGDSHELDALAGDFLRTVQRNGWCDAGRQLLLSEPVLRAFYKKRWNDIVALRGPEVELTLDEDRVRFAFLIDHPFVALSTSPARERKLQRRLVKRLGERDPSYPALLAEGILSYRDERYPEAAALFSRHLELAPDGPYTLRAQNYLRSALERQ